MCVCIRVMYAGMALATMFVTLPFIVRELIPILESMDMSQEEAARTLGANDWQASNGNKKGCAPTFQRLRMC